MPYYKRGPKGTIILTATHTKNSDNEDSKVSCSGSYTNQVSNWDDISLHFFVKHRALIPNNDGGKI